MPVHVVNISGDNFIVWSHTDYIVQSYINFLKTLQKTSMLPVLDDKHIRGRNFSLL